MFNCILFLGHGLHSANLLGQTTLRGEAVHKVTFEWRHIGLLELRKVVNAEKFTIFVGLRTFYAQPPMSVSLWVKKKSSFWPLILKGRNQIKGNAVETSLLFDNLSLGRPDVHSDLVTSGLFFPVPNSGFQQQHSHQFLPVYVVLVFI